MQSMQTSGLGLPALIRQRLHFQGLLGRGAFGCVYLATYKTESASPKLARNQQVAVKMVHMDGDHGVIKKMGRMLSIQNQLAREAHPDVAHLLESYMVS